MRFYVTDIYVIEYIDRHLFKPARVDASSSTDPFSALENTRLLSDTVSICTKFNIFYSKDKVKISCLEYFNIPRILIGRSNHICAESLFYVSVACILFMLCSCRLTASYYSGCCRGRCCPYRRWQSPFMGSNPYSPPLVLTFAGDLMAHTVNFNMKSYDLIYTDVEKYYIMMI